MVLKITDSDITPDGKVNKDITIGKNKKIVIRSTKVKELPCWTSKITEIDCSKCINLEQLPL